MNPAGVICEIMNDDGTMARSDLVKFAQFHGLKIGTIADLISYRRRTETTGPAHAGNRAGQPIRRRVPHDDLRQQGRVRRAHRPGEGRHHDAEPVLVRMHALNVLDDVLHDRSCGRGGDLQAAMREIGEEGQHRGADLQPQPTSLSSRVKAQIEGVPNPQAELRDYGVGAQILFDLGVREMILLSNHKKTIIGLDGYGLPSSAPWPINPAISGAD